MALLKVEVIVFSRLFPLSLGWFLLIRLLCLFVRFFGTNLIPLQKDGGVKAIAVGCTLRRLVAKVAPSKVQEEMANLLAPK